MKTWTAKPVDTTTAKQITVNQDSMASRGHSDYSVWLNWFPAFTKWLVGLARFPWDVHLQPCPTVQPPSFLAPDANHCTAFTALAISPALSGGADGAIAAALVARAFFFLAMAVCHNLCRKTENCDALLPLLKKQSADTLQHVHILDLIGSVYSINLKSVQLAGNLKIDHWENLPLLIKSYQNHIFSGVKLSWFHQSCSSCRALLPVGACCDSRCPVASLVFRVFYCWEPNGYLSSLIWLQNGKFVKNQRFRQSERNTCLEESVWNLPPSNPT